MPPREQPVRRKKTNKEVKSTRAKTQQKAARQKKANERRQVGELKRERAEMQGRLADVIRDVKGMHAVVNSDEFTSKLSKDDLAKCNAAVTEFRNDLVSVQPALKESIAELDKLEKQVTDNDATVEDIVLPYNLNMAPLIDTVVAVGQKAIGTMAVCQNVLTKYEDGEVNNDVG